MFDANKVLNCDVLIVGAGPAGSSLAYYLSDKNLKVILIDKKRHLEKPVRCAELVPVNIASLFEFKISGINNQVDFMDTFIEKADGEVRNNQVKHEFSIIKRIYAPGLVLDRDVFIKDIVRRFKKNGGIFFNMARIQKINNIDIINNLNDIGVSNVTGINNLAKNPVNLLNPGSKEVKIRTIDVGILYTDNSFKDRSNFIKVKTKIIVGADGPLSLIGRLINSGNKSFMLGMQEKLRLNDEVYNSYNTLYDNLNHAEKYMAVSEAGAVKNGRTPYNNSVQFFFSPDIKCGYGWIFPKRDYVNTGAGIGSSFAGELKTIYEYFKKRLLIGFGEGNADDTRHLKNSMTIIGKDSPDDRNLISSNIIGKVTGIIPVSGMVAKPAAGNYILLGDAAGLCNPITGAGIYNAINSAKLSSVVLAKSIYNDDLTLLNEINEIFYREFGPAVSRALEKRKFLEKNWPYDSGINSYGCNYFEELIRKTWPVFKDYFLPSS